MKLKKLLAFILVLMLLFSLSACGKSQAVKDAEAAIEAIGEVTIDSKDAITLAEKLYSILTESEKAEVENRLMLANAQEAYAELSKKLIYENAKNAYDKLNQIAALCIDGMDDIYGAWYFGIYDADDCTSSTVLRELSYETSFTSSELEAALESLGIGSLGPYLMTSDWQYCLYAVEEAHVIRGTYDNIDTLLAETQAILQTLTETYSDYEYYPKLKEYYSKVSSYAAFFKSPTGSFKQLADTINDYENNIRTYQSDIGFLF